MANAHQSVLDLARAAFRQEAEDLLAELDSASLQLEAAPSDADALNRAFRALHTLKGSGATAGFGDIASVVHGAEDVFNGARGGKVRISPTIIDLVLKIGDVVRRMLSASGGEAPGLFEEGKKLVAELNASVLPAVAEVVPGSLYQAIPKIAPAPAPPSAGLWHIHFAPPANLFQTGGEPALLLRELMSLGHGVVRASTERLVGEPAFDPTLCYLSWDIQIATAESEQTIRDVFMFVEDESDLRIEPIAPAQAWVLPLDAYFDPALMEEFREEASQDIAEIEAYALVLEEAPEDAAHRDALKRALHNLKGVCQLVLSDVRRPPPARHPIRGMSELCHAAESYLGSFSASGSSSFGEGGWGALIEIADALRSLIRAGDEAREAWPTDLLEGLGAAESALDIAAQPPASARGAAHGMTRSVAEQCGDVVRAIEGHVRPEAPPPATDWEALARALGTLEKATSFEGAKAVSAKVHTLVTICEKNARETSVEIPVWNDFRALYRDVMKAIEAPSEAAPPPVSARSRGRIISLRPSKPAVRPSGKPSRSPQAAPAAALAPRSVRVDQAKLDILMGAIGELLVAKNALPVLVSRVRASESQAGKEIKATVDRIAHIADDLQDAMRQIRMMPIRSIFQRFPRMIRDLSRSEDKQVQLVLSGEETELDKTVLEQIADPLVHLVRNAVDHGIELPADRAAAGKPEMGTVGLEVLKEGSHVVIRVSDDGRGMSPDRLRAKAVEKGLLSAAEAAEMTDKRALELVFLPGLSTAEKVTDVSGRGVGMDVVMSNIRQIHGTVTLASEPGKGSVVSIKLPTSLMVSKGMLVESASEQYVLPIEGVREMVKIRREQIRQFGDVAMTSIRGSICAVFSLARLLGISTGQAGEGLLEHADEANAAIVSTPGGMIAVLVDKLVAEIDVIVKPLSGGLDKLSLFQGATILGDGSVALVLDLGKLESLVGLGARQQASTPAAQLQIS